MSDDKLEQAKQDFQAGKAAFERGAYRQSVEYLERANDSLKHPSRLGGDVQVWLVSAYQANGQDQEAIALCRRVSRHPDYQTAKQGKQLLYILEAPKLRTRPEWLTKIPDLGGIDEQAESTLAKKYAANRPKKERSPRSKTVQRPEPTDLSQVNTKDNGFVWVALIVTLLTLVSILVFR